jgi:3(or 17)beta-hydroxysteroid dehydrogenase
MSNRLEGNVAIITGAAAGIGAATAELFAGHGAVVVMTDVDALNGRRRAAEISGKYGGNAIFIEHDVRNSGDWKSVFKEALSRFGKLNTLVNNAGIQITRSLEDISLEEWRNIFSVNTEGPFLGTQLAIATMKDTGGGAIINVSSTFAMVADGLNAHYCASKAAISHFTKAAALYCADRKYRIRVNSVHPGVIRTPMVEREIAEVANERGLGSTASVEAEWQQLCPLGIGTPTDIAEGIVYLASDAARYLTGAELVIDGGHIIR